MASVISSVLSSSSAAPSISIINATTGSSVANGIKVKSVKIRLNSAMLTHMREDGATIADARIIHASVIEMDIYCPTIDDVESVIDLMNDRQNMYTVTAKGIVFENMMVMATQNKQTPEVLSAAPFVLVFKEQLLENVAPVICMQSGDSDTQDNGLQLLNNIGNNINNFVTTVRNNAVNAVNQITGFFGG